MFRRDFLKAFAAVASAALSGGAAAAAVGTTVARSSPSANAATAASRKTTPQVAITANTTQFSSEIERVRSLLSECRLVSIGETTLRDGGCVITASYRHDPDGKPTALDEQWGEYLSDAGIRSVEVSSSYEEIDVFHLGIYQMKEVLKPVRDITVEYVKGW